ncbi:hypothetical protein ACCO45_008740 [Purpureocillium lilacinum]|uniref:Uncharacterized protein n=1 Tax=Purpureocillium lilacinum TaxID=33203 RepID=A0ACC4DHW8_PURLI
MGAHPALRTSAPSPSHHHKQHTHSPGIGIREPSAAVGPSYGGRPALARAECRAGCSRKFKDQLSLRWGLRLYYRKPMRPCGRQTIIIQNLALPPPLL